MCIQNFDTLFCWQPVTCQPTVFFSHSKLAPATSLSQPKYSTNVYIVPAHMGACVDSACILDHLKIKTDNFHQMRNIRIQTICLPSKWHESWCCKQNQLYKWCLDIDMCKCGTGRLINFDKSTNKLGIQGQLVLPPLQNVYRFDFLIRFIVFTMYLGSCLVSFYRF